MMSNPLHNSKALYTLVGALIVVGIVAGLINNQRNEKAEKGRNALYAASRTYQTQLEAMKPAPDPAGAAASGTKDKKAEPVLPPGAGAKFEKLDVDAKLADSVAKYKAVIKDYDGSRAAFEARLALGDLYFNHGEAAKAAPWYAEATQSAPAGFEKMLSFYSLGHSQESAGKPKEALEAYENALNLGEGLKGDLMLAIARNHESLKDTAKAKSTYEQILSQLPNTEYARLAEFFKGRL
jgi:TolA-binding protein